MIVNIERWTAPVAGFVRDYPGWTAGMIMVAVVGVLVAVSEAGEGGEQPAHSATAAPSWTSWMTATPEPVMRLTDGGAVTRACQGFWESWGGVYDSGDVTNVTPYVGGSSIYTVQVADRRAFAGTCVVVGSGTDVAGYELVKLCDLPHVSGSVSHDVPRQLLPTDDRTTRGPRTPYVSGRGFNDRGLPY